MKYFKVFNTEGEYIEYIASGITPNVSTLRDSSNTWINPSQSVVHVTGVTLSEATVTITKGNTTTLVATVSPNDAYDKSVTWSTSDSTVATVNDGVVTAVGCGEAIITVTTTDGGYTAQCTTTVENPVTGVTLNTNVAYILTGETYQLVATVAPSDACGDKSVTWSTSDSSIATVSNNGLVTAVAAGSATVTVTTTVGSHTATCAVEVSEPVAVTSVTLDESTLDVTVGQTRQLTATVLPSDAHDKSVTWSSSNNNIATVTSNGLVTAVSAGTANIIVTTTDGGYTAACEVTVTDPGFTSMVIEGASVVSAETCTFRAICDNVEDVTSSATWSITAGSQYATINSSTGEVTILNGANESSVTIQAVYAGLTARTAATLTYLAGAASVTTSNITTDIGGNSTSVVTTITTYADSSSTEVVETVVTDVNGDLVGSSESTKTTNADGSYNGVTTNYDENGDPVNGSNVTGDTKGNVSTQTVEYDDSGNATVTGYDIDTTESESGKTFNSGGTNTEYYAFDLTHGFVLDFDFTIDFSKQPTGQDGNHHNILNAKRADPSPWYGFQIRHSDSSGKTITLGTQFSGGSNVNTVIPTQLTGDTARYIIKITYDPTAQTDKFVLTDMRTGNIVFSYNDVFPDIEALRYLKVTIGYAINSSGNPFRYSNITVSNFNLKKLKHVANPTITCENNVVTIDCDTVGASVYYRLNLHGDYSAYTTSFTITADTVVQAYATYSGDTSDIIREDCEYGLEKPVISCDGEEVTITCPNTGVTIYYRLNESGTYSAYTTPIPITADTVVEAYSELGVETSDVVKETCLVNIAVTGVTLNENSITINRFETYTLSATVLPNNATNKNVTWSSSNVNVATVDSNGVVSSVASGSATITVTTVDGGFTAQCSVSVTNRYAYFTLVSLADNNTFTLKNGSSATRNLSYSLDDGTTWTSFSLATGATQTIATINSGDTIIMKGNNTQLANDYNKGCYFRGTKNYEVEGNISSLLRNNDTDTEITGGTFHFAQLFSGDTHLISAENLKVVSTTLYQSSFNGTFRSCTNLQKAPDLSIPTTLGQETYSSMFEACTSLSQPPSVLSATTAQLSSYKRMFCMARSGTVSAQMTKSPIMIGNFGSETSVSKDFQVFKGNGSLTEVKCFWTNTSNSFGSLSEWMSNVSSSGTFYKRSTQTFQSSANGIPTGWTVVTDDNTGN